MSKKGVGADARYWARIVICVMSFGMIFPNALVERMDPQEMKSDKPGPI